MATATGTTGPRGLQSGFALHLVFHSHVLPHTHPFSGPFSATTRVSRYQKWKNNLDFTEARDSEWQWHQLGHMQVCTSLQTDNQASTPPLSFFTGRMLFLPPNQQRQSTEGRSTVGMFYQFHRNVIASHQLNVIFDLHVHLLLLVSLPANTV